MRIEPVELVKLLLTASMVLIGILVGALFVVRGFEEGTSSIKKIAYYHRLLKGLGVLTIPPILTVGFAFLCVFNCVGIWVVFAFFLLSVVGLLVSVYLLSVKKA